MGPDNIRNDVDGLAVPEHVVRDTITTDIAETSQARDFHPYWSSESAAAVVQEYFKNKMSLSNHPRDG